MISFHLSSVLGASSYGINFPPQSLYPNMMIYLLLPCSDTFMNKLLPQAIVDLIDLYLNLGDQIYSKKTHSCHLEALWKGTHLVIFIIPMVDRL